MVEVKIGDKSYLIVSTYNEPSGNGKYVSIGKYFKTKKNGHERKIITKSIAIPTDKVDWLVKAMKQLEKEIEQQNKKQTDTKQVSGIDSSTIKMLWELKETLPARQYEAILKKILKQ